MAIKDTNLQRSILISKELSKRIDEEVKKDCSSFNAVVKKILTKYFEDK